MHEVRAAAAQRIEWGLEGCGQCGSALAQESTNGAVSSGDAGAGARA